MGLEKGRREERAQGFCRVSAGMLTGHFFPLLLNGALGEIEITIKGETTEALVDTWATLSIFNTTQ